MCAHTHFRACGCVDVLCVSCSPLLCIACIHCGCCHLNFPLDRPARQEHFQLNYSQKYVDLQVLCSSTYSVTLRPTAAGLHHCQLQLITPDLTAAWFTPAHLHKLYIITSVRWRLATCPDSWCSDDSQPSDQAGRLTRRQLKILRIKTKSCFYFYSPQLLRRCMIIDIDSFK